MPYGRLGQHTGRIGRAPYILIITKRRSAKKQSTEPKENFIGFATNVPDVDIAEYCKRWGIETGYSMIEKIRVWTRSKKICARVFCFAFTLLLYNVWVMLNALLETNAEIATRFGITLTTFRISLLCMTLHAPKKPPQPLPKGSPHAEGGGARARLIALA